MRGLDDQIVTSAPRANVLGVDRVLTNDFSWSKSRHEKFSDCRRAYYFHYYQSWGGWDEASPPDVRNLYILKKLDNRFTWAGGVVHAIIRRALQLIRGGRFLTESQAVERAYRLMRWDYKHSVRKAYWQQKTRVGFFGLAEHEYAEPIPRNDWKTNWETAKAALEWFFRSRWIEEAKSLGKAQWLEIDEKEFEKSVFDLEGVRVFAIPDFAYFDRDGNPTIVDWKTGKGRSGYDEQVIAYALYLSRRYGLEVSRIRAVIVYLNEGLERDVRIDPEAVERFRAYFRTSIADMRDLLADSSANLPKPLEEFPMTDNLLRCRTCVFRRPCGRERLAAAPLQLPAIIAAAG